MRVLVDVWSDYVCPFCYLEEPVLTRLAQEMGEKVVVRWRAFELRPEPMPALEPDGPYLHDIWARGVYPMAEHRGMELHLPPMQPRSRLAHEAAHHALLKGSFDRMNNALFKAFFEDGRDIGDAEVLADVGASIGLETGSLRQALSSGRHRAEVQAEAALASDLGLAGVPAILLRRKDGPPDGTVELSGALPYDAIHGHVERLLRQES